MIGLKIFHLKVHRPYRSRAVRSFSIIIGGVILFSKRQHSLCPSFRTAIMLPVNGISAASNACNLWVILSDGLLHSYRSSRTKQKEGQAVLCRMNFDKFYQHAYNWVITYGPRFVIGLIVLFTGLWLIRLLVRWSTNRMQHKKVDPTVKPFLLSLVTIALRIILIIAVMEIMGIHLTLLTALIGAFGVAAGLALSGTLQNFASGILILLLKPFVVGDNILTQGVEGTVMSIEIFYTIVRTYDHRDVIFPNGMLSNNMIINISREGNRRLDILYKFANGVDIKEAKKVIGKAVDESEQCLKTPERRIGVSLLEKDGFTLSINVWVNAHGFEDSKQAVQENILQALKGSGLKIDGV